MIKFQIIEINDWFEESVYTEFESESCETAWKFFLQWVKHVNQTKKTCMLIPHNQPRGYIFPQYFENNITGYCYKLR